MDDGVEQAIRRPPRAAGNVYAGIVSRAVAFGVDLLLIVAIFTVLSGFGALITSLVGTLRPTWLVGRPARFRGGDCRGRLPDLFLGAEPGAPPGCPCSA